ncbi:Fic family protein [Aliirhizobium terrae]|uniref:Fic/DOC family protein n=1 Tax=Terrirhizobium terrae TaxID=2926709 RepID=UPI002575720A|nr:Fic family protein [Rhizobium sp. CC-CFT758]WJH40933.1 Fic family protein [Rhizobium sp. CC-CFT758]
MSDDPYVYPGTKVLRNKFNIRDSDGLDLAERRYSTIRSRQGIPAGDFDLKHLRAIHRHLFQDIFDWAGEIRTVEISKGGSQFQFRQYIEIGMSDVHRRLMSMDFLRGLNREEFAVKAASIMGDVNYVHPFREGNGRTQLQYFKQLSGQAGHSLDLTKIGAADWLNASIAAHRGEYGRMADVIIAAFKSD